MTCQDLKENTLEMQFLYTLFYLHLVILKKKSSILLYRGYYLKGKRIISYHLTPYNYSRVPHFASISVFI